jgi:hypothetical protein
MVSSPRWPVLPGRTGGWTFAHNRFGIVVLSPVIAAGLGYGSLGVAYRRRPGLEGAL